MKEEILQHGSGDSNKKTGRIRYVIFALCLSLAALGILARYGYLMLFSPLRERQSEQYYSRPSGRGPILDRNGRILALETKLADITLWMPDVDDWVKISNVLAPLLDMRPQDIIHRIESTVSNSVTLKWHVSLSTAETIREAISAHGLKGVNINYVPGRIYPERTLASQVIGLVGVDGRNQEGIEFVMNHELSPSAGTNKGDNVGGSQVFLTLDVNVQHILENIAAQVLRENRAEAVMFMAMDPRTGDILGSASLPGFDPNNFQNSRESSRMNRPAVWDYEPGSVFKVFTLAALMDSGVIGDDTFFTCNGQYELINAAGRQETIRCLSSHGRVNARDIIVYSCNAGAAYASDRLSDRDFYDNLRNFGFGARTGAGTSGETTGLFRTPEHLDWTRRSKPTLAMGQEISVSALQMLQAASAIANDGVLVPPRIVSRIVSADGRNVRYFETGQARRIISPETARYMRSYMMDVTSNIGTGWRANVEDLSLAVKTGTSQMSNPRSGYSDTDFIASCIALLPAENPSLVLYLAIIKPQGASFLGGRIAAPPIREAAEALINYLGIPRGRNPQIVHSGAVSIPLVHYPVVDDIVPDFYGLAKRMLQPLFAREDLFFQVNGEGWVVRQSPAPGTLISGNTMIVLELE